MNTGALCRAVSCVFLLAASPLLAQPTARGLVLDGQKKPLAGARAELLPVLSQDAQRFLRVEAAPVAAAVTDAAGRFSLQADRPGLFTVRIASPEKVSLSFGPIPLVEPTDLPPVALLAAGERAPGRLGGWKAAPRAAPAAASPPIERFTMAGRVVTESGARPVAGALVWSAADPGAAVLTDADGRYQIRLPAAGSSWIQAQAPGRLPQRIVPNEAQRKAGRGPSIALPAAENVAGRVVDAAGAPLSGAWINALPALKEGAPARGRAAGRGALSGADGTFRLTVLQPGELYDLEATRPGFVRATARALAPPAGRRAGPPVVLTLTPARPAFGRVLDDRRRPVAGAAVRVAAHDAAGEAPEAIADAQGRFTVAEVPALALDIQVSKAGHAPALVRNLKVPAGSGPIDLGSISLRPGAAVAGLVSGPRGRPVAGARIYQVEKLQLPFEMAERLRKQTPAATSGADGRFALSDLSPGVPVHLLVTAPGHLPAVVRGVRPPAAAPLKIRLEAAVRLAGRVIDREGAPVPGAEVGAVWHDSIEERPDLPTGPPVLKTARAGSDGRFEIADLPAGGATLTASATGFVESDEIKVVLPQPAGAAVTIVLERGATVSGRISTTAGEPVAQARILAGSATGISDSEGIYSVDGVAPGPLEVEVRHPYYERFRKAVRIEPGTNQLDVVFEAGREVRGRVIDPDGAPVPGAAVVLAAEDRRKMFTLSTRSDAEGGFTLSPVAAGSYRLKASAQGYAETELPRPVVVGRQEIQQVEVVLAPGGTISGRILGLEPDELPRAGVWARRETGESKVAEIDAAGNYLLSNLAAGDWLVQARVGEGQRQVQARVPLAAGGEETRDLRFGGNLTLSGLVLYRDEPLPDAAVSIRGQQLAVERSGVTDHEGRFRFEELDADTYRLGLTQARELLTHNQTVELSADRALTIRLEHGSISGTVVDAGSSEPLPEARIDLRRVATPDSPEFLIGGGSDAAGAFRLDRVPPGSYRLIVSREGYAPAERTVEMTASDLSNVEVPLKPAPGAEIAVRLASGNVPPFLHLRLQAADGTPVLVESRPIGPDGILKITTAPPGSWTLLAGGPDAGLSSLALTLPGKPQTLVLPDAAPLAVRVAPLARSDAFAVLSIAAAGGPPLKILGPGGSLTQQWQLEAGRATVAGVPAGNWIVSATAPDGRTWTAAVTTDGRSAAQIDLQ